MIETIAAHAREVAPQEACGLVVRQRGLEVWRSMNQCAEPEKGFQVDPELMYRALHDTDGIAFVYHSHPTGNEPSELDQRGCSALGIPYLVYFVQPNRHVVVRPEPWWLDLCGHEWAFGAHDCLTIAQEYYARRGICVGLSLSGDPSEADDVDAWQAAHCRDILRLGTEELGFRRVDDRQPGDLLIFQARRHDYPGHLAVYLGDRQILHHSVGGLSCVELLPERLEAAIVCVLRYAE